MAADYDRLVLLQEHTLELCATVAVTILMVAVARGLTSIMKPKASSVEDTPGDVNLLAEYGRAWCLHQFVPFVDKLVLGSYGQAMDNRMLKPWDQGPDDWMIRLPILIVSFIFPTPWLLLVAHVANIASWWYWMPNVWDHMVWAALLEVTFVLAALAGGGGEAVAKRFIPAARAELVVLYWSAAFWKLTSSWYAVRSSCAPVLMSELMAGIFTPELTPPGSALSNTLLGTAPVFVAALEFAVATSLMFFPAAGVVLALGFHQSINLMPMTYAGGFSISMCCRFVLFLPGVASKSLGRSSSFILPSAMCTAVGAAMYAIHAGVDTACMLYLFLAFLYFRGIMSGHTPAKGGYGGAAWLSFLAVLVGFLYGFLAPVAGVMAMASSTMYGNVKQWGGTNHLVVPTGLLQEHFADPRNAEPAWAADAFGGGLVRVDGTTSSVMRRLAPAEATPLMLPFARDLLQGAGTPGRYFELYAARNYFGRDDDHESSALHNRGNDSASGADAQDLPYVEPAYELRRVLALARAKGESFTLRYTKVPWYGTPQSYAAYKGEQVVLEEDAATGKRSCTVGGAPCGDSEVALLPAPQWWLTKILHPYPLPILPGDVRDIHCST